MDKIITGLLTLAFAFVLVVIMTICGSFVTFKLWHWLVMPIFGVTQSITLAQAFGIGVLLSVFKASNVKSEKEGWEAIGFTFLNYAFTLLFGYVAHLLIV